jgi:mRNA interferase MazF
MVKRFDVVLVVLDPTSGHEIQKTRPCLVVSPDEMNHYLGTVIVAPMTTKGTHLPFRVECRFRGKRGRIVLASISTVLEMANGAPAVFIRLSPKAVAIKAVVSNIEY